MEIIGFCFDIVSLNVGNLVFKLIPFLGYRWDSVDIQIQTDYDSVRLLVSDVFWQDLC